MYHKSFAVLFSSRRYHSIVSLSSPFVHAVVPEQQNNLIKHSHMLYVSMANRGLLGKSMGGTERRLGMGEATLVLLPEVV